jgi:hypothetical protein
MNKKLLIFELVLICLTFLFGSYFFYWEILLRKDISNQEYFNYFRFNFNYFVFSSQRVKFK